MAIKISQAFERTSREPIDVTLTLTKAQMLAVEDSMMPDKYFTICQDDGKLYLYDKEATPSLETGKFSVFEGGSGVELTQAEYDALTPEQKLDGTVYFVTDGQGGGGGADLPSGGTTGQVLTKKSNADCDVEWKDVEGSGQVELTQAEYTALSEEEKMNGNTYFITDGGTYVPAVDVIPHVNQAPIVVGKLDLRGDGEFRDIKRVRLWISDLKNASEVITAGWVETGVYVRPIRIYGWFTFHDTVTTPTSWEYRIQQLPIPYSGYTPIESPSGTTNTIGLKFYIDHNNKLRMVVEGKSNFATEDYACVIVDFMETPIT